MLPPLLLLGIICIGTMLIPVLATLGYLFENDGYRPLKASVST